MVNGLVGVLEKQTSSTPQLGNLLSQDPERIGVIPHLRKALATHGNSYPNQTTPSHIIQYTVSIAHHALKMCPALFQ